MHLHRLGIMIDCQIRWPAQRLLNAERSTLFLNDEKTHELWSEVGQGLESVQIRLPNHVGIAGAVFTSGKSIATTGGHADPTNSLRGDYRRDPGPKAGVTAMR